MKKGVQTQTISSSHVWATLFLHQAHTMQGTAKPSIDHNLHQQQWKSHLGEADTHWSGMKLLMMIILSAAQELKKCC